MMRKLFSAILPTPLGSLIAVGDTQALYLLQFADSVVISRLVRRLEQKFEGPLIPDLTPPLLKIKEEVKQYFDGMREFSTPMVVCGIHFQNRVFEKLKSIPPGETRSYAQIAQAIGQPTATRAVGQAIGCNPLIIAIPCHRVIRSDGTLGGYSNGIERKEWLLKHEGF